MRPKPLQAQLLSPALPLLLLRPPQGLEQT